MSNLSIDLSSQSIKTIQIFFDKLFTYIYLIVDIKLIEYKSKLYFEITNHWGGGEPKDITPEQKAKLAHKDCECECESDIICKNKDLKYIYSWNHEAFEDFDQSDQSESNKYVCDLIKSIDEFIKKNGEFAANNVHICLANMLLINNLSGFNHDNRGSNHIPLDLPWKSTTQLNANFNLNDFIDVVFLIKSHKFDKWYEMYCRIKSINQNDNFIELNVQYDHGS